MAQRVTHGVDVNPFKSDAFSTSEEYSPLNNRKFKPSNGWTSTTLTCKAILRKVQMRYLGVLDLHAALAFVEEIIESSN